MLGFLIDLVVDLLPASPQVRRVRRLRRKLVRYVRHAPDSAFSASEAKHLDGSGEIRREVRAKALDLARRCALDDVQDWGDVSARYFDALERDLAGVVVQLPPDEPRMAFAGDKSL
ncbi:MAG: hypothetical protein JNJ88_20905 [Planctomycetes bacterium]|nr:hypothetical protein [Planctomycetota bacterium]